MELLKYTCPGCGGSLHPRKGDTLVSCEYCRSTTELPKPAGISEKELSRDVALFSTTQADFVEAARAWFVLADHLPDGVIDTLDFSAAEGVYLPLQRLKIKYKSHWSASCGYRKWNKTKHEYVWHWRPSRGTVVGTFTGIGMSCEALPDSLVPFCEACVPAPSDMQEHSLRQLASLPQEEETLSTQEVFDRRLRDCFFGEIATRVRMNVPGDKFKDLDHSVDADTALVTALSVAFWILPYEYHGERYYCAASGLDLQLIHGTRPADEESKSKARSYFLPAIAATIVGLIAFVAASPHDTAQMAIFWGGLVLTFALLVWGGFRQCAFLEQAREHRRQRLAGL